MKKHVGVLLLLAAFEANSAEYDIFEEFRSDARAEARAQRAEENGGIAERRRAAAEQETASNQTRIEAIKKTWTRDLWLDYFAKTGPKSDAEVMRFMNMRSTLTTAERNRFIAQQTVQSGMQFTKFEIER